MKNDSPEKVRAVFVATLQEFLGTKAPKEIHDTADPIKDLGLDSMDGVDFACVLSEKFGCRIPDDLNPLVDDTRHCGRRVGDMIKLVTDLLEMKEAQ
jgi:acyl carrier protein